MYEYDKPRIDRLRENALKPAISYDEFYGYFNAAYLDGCGPFRTFLKVMIPNAGSSFLTVFLFSVVWYWNDYYVAGSFFSNHKTISMVLKNLDATLNVAIFNNANANVSVREKIIWLEAGCLISITPLLILYACLQKHFTEGIERSGLVG